MNTPDLSITRRELLRRTGTGLPLLALSAIEAADDATHPLAPKKPHFAAKAKHVVHLFMNGGPSQVDTFDPKPLLKKYHGQPLPTANLRTERKTGAAMGSPFTFRKYGESGLEISELFQQTAQWHADKLCVIRSMKAEVPNHEPSLMLMNCGDSRLPRPSFGSWATYGLGSENQNLPGFVAMCPGGYPIVATQNWRSSFLPGAYQGTYLNTQHKEVDKLVDNIRNSSLNQNQQRHQLDLVQKWNRRHLERNNDDPLLEARIQAHELAFRMQTEAADVFDLSKESKWTRELYGDTVVGRQLLLTRRMIEKASGLCRSGQGQVSRGITTITLLHSTDRWASSGISRLQRFCSTFPREAFWMKLWCSGVASLAGPRSPNCQP